MKMYRIYSITSIILKLCFILILFPFSLQNQQTEELKFYSVGRSKHFNKTLLHSKFSILSKIDLENEFTDEYILERSALESLLASTNLENFKINLAKGVPN